MINVTIAAVVIIIVIIGIVNMGKCRSEGGGGKNGNPEIFPKKASLDRLGLAIPYDPGLLFPPFL